MSLTQPASHRDPPLVGQLAARESVGRERLSEIQRARILSAMVEVVAERGAANASVSHVVARSGVSRRTFYELFEDREDCFLAAFEQAMVQISAVVLPAYERRGPWRVRMRAALLALLELLDRERGVGRLVIVESLAVGSTVFERRARVLAQVTAAVDGGRMEGRGGDRLPPLTAEGVVGGVLAVLHSRLLEDGDGSLLELSGPFMSMIVAPYLGRAAARRELERPLPSDGDKAARGVPDPLSELHMRLTYRTVRVLLAVAANPGASNRAMADAAGIRDQGQISKLLARLQRLGLIENTGAEAARGEPNAWELTQRGRGLHGAIAETTTTHN
jgi:AcrR family transcriptional regulator